MKNPTTLKAIKETEGTVARLIKQDWVGDRFINGSDIRQIAIFPEGLRVDLKSGDSFYVPIEETTKQVEIPVNLSSS